MAAIDWIIVLIYAISMLWMGSYVGRKQTSSKDYFIGGGAMNPILIGVSLFATLLSTISYLAMPGEVSGKGPAYLATYLAHPLTFLFIGFVILPVYMRQRVTSAYELLEAKLGLSIRLLGVVMFLALRLVWMSLLIFLTAKAIAIMIQAPDTAVPLIVMATGAFAVVYTSLGGLRAVVITDLVQTLLLYGGALLVIGTVTWRMGGFGWFPTEWHPSWDSQPIFSFDPSVRVTVVGSIITSFLWLSATMSGDQVSVQRFMATKDAKAARTSLLVQMIVGIIVAITLCLVGLSLLGYFQAQPELLPLADQSLRSQADRLFPHFIAFELPPVITGLVVSGLFAAAMSSVDSGVNSITAVAMNDIWGRLGKGELTADKQLRLSRWLAVIIGAIVVTLSSQMGLVEGNFMEKTQKLVNLLTVPIALLFIFALFVPFANPRGVWIGTIASVAAAGTVAFSGELIGRNPETGDALLTFQLIAPAAVVFGLGVGLPACWLLRKRAPAAS